METVRRSILSVAFVVLATLIATTSSASAQATPCDTPEPTVPFVLASSATGLTLAIAHAPEDFSGTATYLLEFRSSVGGSVINSQSVARASATAIGPLSTDAGRTCYRLPVASISGFPRARGLNVTVTAMAAEPAFSSEASSAIPFGVAVRKPGVRAAQ